MDGRQAMKDNNLDIFKTSESNIVCARVHSAYIFEAADNSVFRWKLVEVLLQIQATSYKVAVSA